MSNNNRDLASITRGLMEFTDEREAIIKAHKKELSELDSKIEKLRKLNGVAVAGFDLSKVSMAESLVRVSGSPDSPERGRAVSRAVKKVACEPIPMRRQYVGVKQCSGFGDQGCDCEYGMGPRHGHIVFRIESLKRKDEWSEIERDAAIYYLSNISKIHKAKQEAA